MEITMPIGVLAGPDLESELEQARLIAQGDAMLAQLERERAAMPVFADDI